MVFPSDLLSDVLFAPVIPIGASYISWFYLAAKAGSHGRFFEVNKIILRRSCVPETASMKILREEQRLDPQKYIMRSAR